MFEVPKSQINLMNDYKEWIEKALIKKYEFLKGNKRTLKYKVFNELKFLTREELWNIYKNEDCIKAPLGLSPSEGLKWFVEDHIGIDFVILKGLKGSVFCIHSADDFLTEVLGNKF